MSVSMENTNGSLKKQGWWMLTGAALILLLLFWRLYFVLAPQLAKTATALQEGRAMLLDNVVNKALLQKIITDGNYFTDPRDVQLLTDSLSQKLFRYGTPPNLGTLNKRAYNITAPVPWQSPVGGIEFRNRLRASRQRLGFDSVLYNQELHGPIPHPATLHVGSGELAIRGRVLHDDQPLAGVLVQLKQHVALPASDSTKAWTAWARTNAKGEFAFTGLLRDSGYSVLPMKPGFEFTRQGTMRLRMNKEYAFHAKPHTLRLIGPVTYSQIKQDGALVVRDPESFKKSYQFIVTVLIAAFILVQLLLTFRKNTVDVFLLPVLLLLCGLSLLMMFSIQHPLTDTLYAAQTVQGIIAGLALFYILSLMDMRTLYSRWWFDALFNYKKKKIYQLKGWTWLAMALVLAIATALAGTGPEGSGVKVNLQLGGISFQPGEITKYLLLFFLAAFFAANEEHVRSFTDIRWRLYVNVGVLAGISLLLALYLLMGDMGPAMVICFTFLFFYSMAHGNLLQTLIAGTLYCTLLWLLPAWMATLLAFPAVLIIMATHHRIRTGKWYGVFAAIADAPMIVLLVIAAFAFGDQLPGIGHRLADRKAMWLSQWNNDVFGGDHLAHSYWALGSGGFGGQGIGQGFPNSMPAAHTDMVLPAIGEELGWLGLVTVFLLFAILIHRSFLHGRRAAQPFGFYLCAGIAIATGIQFLLIAGGAIGLLPLTGVAVPFLSYGNISLIINLAAMGIIAGMSARPGATVQQEYVQKNYDTVLITGISFFLIGMLVLATKLFLVQIVDRNQYLTKPARVVMKNGLPVYSYNPRIDKLMQLLAAGNIYDRKGVLLATSEPADIRDHFETLQRAGLDRIRLQELLHKRVRRYYPFGEHLFFWTGDYNTKLFWAQSNGYFAEARHLSSLRGFGITREQHDSVLVLHQPDRFTKPYYQTVQLTRFDYAALKGALRAGMDTTAQAIRNIRHKDRNVYLTVDAALQVELQDSISKSRFADKRISVVVLDAASGDVLASALHPLPSLQSPALLLLSDRERECLEFPVTDRDLGMTYATAPGSAVKILTALAAFNKMGMDAASVKYTDITRNEIFRDNKKEQEPFVPKVPFVDMREAIINSSNIFFIRLANEQYLEEEMADLYQATGMHLNHRGGYDYHLPKDEKKRNADRMFWRKDVLNKDHRQYDNPANAGKTRRYRSLFSGIAWGQSVLTATPASMARMAGALANRGSLQPSRYVLQEAGTEPASAPAMALAKDTGYAHLIRQYMIEQSSMPGRQKIRNYRVAGKTGTPERIIQGEKESDGWYVFFAPTPDGRSHTVACIRIERGQSSANAVNLANTVANILGRRGYITSF